MPVGVGQRLAPVGGDDRQRDREVGARLVDPDAAGDVDEDVGARQAGPAVAREHGEDHRQAVAVDPVRDAARRHDLGRARPAPGPRPAAGACPPSSRGRTEPGAARRLADEARRRILDLDQAAGAHLEDADLAGRAEAVLERAQRAEAALALALEEEHAVDQVLEHARPGDGALLGHVPDQDHRAVDPLGDLHDRVRRLADLARPIPARRSSPSRVQRLDRVDHAGVGPLGLERREDVLERGLGDRRDGERAPRRAARRAAGPARPTPRRRRRACGGPRAGQVAERHPGQRRLADPGRAAEQDQRARARGRRRGRGRARRSRSAGARVAGAETSRSAHRLRGGALRARPSRPPRAGFAGSFGASTSVFHSPQPAHCPDQRERLVPAGLTDVCGVLRHPPTLGAGRRRIRPIGTGACDRDGSFILPPREWDVRDKGRLGAALAAALGALALPAVGARPSTPRSRRKNFAKISERNQHIVAHARVPGAPAPGRTSTTSPSRRRSSSTDPERALRATSAPRASNECAGDVRFYDWDGDGFGHPRRRSSSPRAAARRISGNVWATEAGPAQRARRS